MIADGTVINLHACNVEIICAKPVMWIANYAD